MLIIIIITKSGLFGFAWQQQTSEVNYDKL